MIGFLENLSFNQISFWVGFLAGALGLWLFGKLRPTLPGLFNDLRARSKKTRSSFAPNSAGRHRRDTLRYVQGLHLAAPLFSLDEILVEPQLITPPTFFNPGADDSSIDLLSTTIPYMPDWPELAAYYSINTLTLDESLSSGANLILLGHPGSGKTVALASIICKIVRRDKTISDLANFLPIYVHVSDLFPDGQFADQPLDQILNAVRSYITSLSINRHRNLLTQTFQNGRALLLLDGLDEVSPTFHNEVIQFLNNLFTNYPDTRLVVTTSPENFAGLTELGLIPTAMAAWNENRYFNFIRKWSKTWIRFIQPTFQDGFEQPDPRLLNTWLLANNPVISPFDATMRVWAAFVGDTIGPGSVEAIESYIRRLTYHLPKARSALEDFALQMVAALDIALDLKRSRSWQVELAQNESATDQDSSSSVKIKQGKRLSKKLPGVLPELLEKGILVERLQGRIAFRHPLLMAYLASGALADIPISHFLSSQPDWTGKNLTMSFLAVSREMATEVSELLGQDEDPLLRKPLMVGRWLQYAPKNGSWQNQAMHFLATQLQRENISIGLRARLLSALLLSGDQGINLLFRQISYTSILDLQCLAALGMGFLHDPKAFARLKDLLRESNPSIFRSACLALVKIGSEVAFEALGEALLNGSEDLRRSVAESLALHPSEGHNILKEASQMDDLLVRRSAVYGLALIRKPWSKELLESLVVDDQEWVVRAAATQALDEMENNKAGIPQRLPSLHETSWLIEFAGQKGIGIAPGKPAHNLLLSALDEGLPELKVAALRYLELNPDSEALPIVYELLEEGPSQIQEAAFNTLWNNAAAGLDILPLSHAPRI
jgi:HEAT repeat protein